MYIGLTVLTALTALTVLTVPSVLTVLTDPIILTVPTVPTVRSHQERGLTGGSDNREASDLHHPRAESASRIENP